MKNKDLLNQIKLMIPEKFYQLKIDKIDFESNKPNFWQSTEAKSLMQERTKLSDILNKLKYFSDQTSTLEEFIQELPDDIDIKNQYEKLYVEMNEFQQTLFLNEECDENNAILSINSGAGGLESSNWCNMLLRMYLRWADKNKFTTEFLNLKESEEHSSDCIDSVTIKIVGKNAYGLLKGESGTHRLIRISPYSSAGSRHTSFCAVSVEPEINDSIDIKIEDKDIEITAIRSGGKGGQNANKVSSAIHLVYLPLNLHVIAKTERDQLANKKNAFSILYSKLYKLEMDKRQSEKDKLLNQQSDISFGHQIRTYTESPTAIVKDHRTNVEKNNFDKVLDGEIEDFINSYLSFNYFKNNENS